MGIFSVPPMIMPSDWTWSSSLDLCRIQPVPCLFDQREVCREFKGSSLLLICRLPHIICLSPTAFRAAIQVQPTLEISILRTGINSPVIHGSPLYTCKNGAAVEIEIVSFRSQVPRRSCVTQALMVIGVFIPIWWQWWWPQASPDQEGGFGTKSQHITQWNGCKWKNKMQNSVHSTLSFVQKGWQ